MLLAQFKSPLVLILLGAVILSFFLREPVNAAIIIVIAPLGSFMRELWSRALMEQSGFALKIL